MKRSRWGWMPLSTGSMIVWILLLAGLAWAVSQDAGVQDAGVHDAGVQDANVQDASVQVRTGQLRARPSFLGPKVAEVEYADKVTILSERGPWREVTTAAGQIGWMHMSSLSDRQLTLVSGDAEAASGASGEEIALAGKGFNEQVENEYRKKNKDLDYSWVDRMEAMVVTPPEAEKFLAAGGVQPQEGGF